MGKLISPCVVIALNSGALSPIRGIGITCSIVSIFILFELTPQK
jgi:hypothetical protein